MTQHISFNLIDEKWIPCIRSDDGRSDLLSLRETLAESHLLEDIAGDTPLQTAALYRLLIAILLRIYKPTAGDFDTWRAMWTSPTWDMTQINSYLDEQSKRNRFDLFDEERPFYQSDRNGKRDSVVTLKYGTGFRHNPLFDHDNDEIFLSLSPAVAARSLVTIQAFGLGGAGGTRTDAPWSKGVIYFVHGANLKETLFLNLLPYPDEDGGERLTDEGSDLPTWEMEDPFEERKGQPQGYLDLLTWQNLKMMLFPEIQGDEIVVRAVKFGGGLRLAKDFMDPMKFNQKNEQFTDGFRPISFEEDRGLWPNSYAIFARMNMGG
ncbi:MAG: type I-E CRISPR-associated protein Cse1/CasA, partial [Caldilineaceae bacterium]|nr:type I-E CRISPR-associated protein Cse1/CasA [Caldilineaceae bacterium]